MFGTLRGVLGAGASAYSLSFSNSSSQYLSMSAADFGALDPETFALSFWYKILNVGSRQNRIFGVEAGNGPCALMLTQSGADGVQFDFQIIGAGGAGLVGRLKNFDSPYGVSGWHHCMVAYDSTQATAGNRMRLWIDGVQDTVMSATIDPALNQQAQAFDNSVAVGTYGAATGAFTDGLLYQFAVFSGSVPAIGDVYDAGPVDVRGVPGLHSLLLGSGAVAGSNSALATNWTNNNGVTVSNDVPE